MEAYQPEPPLLDYAMTKGASVTFIQGLARVLAERGIRVNAVAPGPVWTPLTPADPPRHHTIRQRHPCPGTANQVTLSGPTRTLRSGRMVKHPAEFLRLGAATVAARMLGSAGGGPWAVGAAERL